MATVVPRRYRSPSRVRGLLLMLFLTAVVLSAVAVIYTVSRRSSWNAQPIPVPTGTATALPMTVPMLEKHGVESAARLTDESGQVQGYVLVVARQGYRSVIRVRCIFSADGATLSQLHVLSQHETEYLGARIGTQEFAMEFAGCRLPVKLWQSAAIGSPIDGYTGSTVSSQAVVDAVNAAYTCLREYLAA